MTDELAHELSSLIRTIRLFTILFGSLAAIGCAGWAWGSFRRGYDEADRKARGKGPG